MHSNQDGSTSRINNPTFKKEVEEGFQKLEEELLSSLKIKNDHGILLKADSYEGSFDKKEVHEDYADFIAAYNTYKARMTSKLNALQKLSVGTDAYSNYEDALRKEFGEIKEQVQSLLNGSRNRAGGVVGAVKEIMYDAIPHAKKRLAEMTQQLGAATEANPFNELLVRQKKIDTEKEFSDELNILTNTLVSSFDLKSMDEYEGQRKEKEADFIKIFVKSLRGKYKYFNGSLLLNMVKIDGINLKLEQFNAKMNTAKEKTNAEWLIQAVLKEMFNSKGSVFNGKDIYQNIIKQNPYLATTEVQNIIKDLVPHFQESVRKCEVKIKERVEGKITGNYQFRKEIEASRSEGNYKEIDLKTKVKEKFQGIKPEETDKFFLENPNIFFYFLLQENDIKENNKVISNLFDSFLKDADGFRTFRKLCEALNSKNEASLEREIQSIIPKGGSGAPDLSADQQQAKKFLVNSFEDFKKLLLQERTFNLREKIRSNKGVTALLEKMITSHEIANSAPSIIASEKLSVSEIILCMPFYVISCMEDAKDLNYDDRLTNIFSMLLEGVERSSDSSQSFSTRGIRSSKAMAILRLLNENKSAILGELQEFTFVQTAEPKQPTKGALSTSPDPEAKVGVPTTSPDPEAEVAVPNKESLKKKKQDALSKEVKKLNAKIVQLTTENEAYSRSTQSEMSKVKDGNMIKRLEVAEEKIQGMEQEQSKSTEEIATLASELSVAKKENDKNKDAIKNLNQKLESEKDRAERLSTYKDRLEHELRTQRELAEQLGTQIHPLGASLAEKKSELCAAGRTLESRDAEIAQLKSDKENLQRDKQNLQNQLTVSQKETSDALSLAMKPRTTGVKRAVAVVVTVGALICIGALVSAFVCPLSAPVSVPTAIATFKLTTATVSVLMGSAGAALVAAGLVPGLIAHFKEKSHLKECTTFKDTLAGGAARVSDNTTSVSVAR